MTVLFVLVLFVSICASLIWFVYTYPIYIGTQWVSRKNPKAAIVTWVGKNKVCFRINYTNYCYPKWKFMLNFKYDEY